MFHEVNQHNVSIFVIPALNAQRCIKDHSRIRRAARKHLPRDASAMRLSPREEDHLLLHAAGALAQKRLARGLRLNYSEAVALLATQARPHTTCRVR